MLCALLFLLVTAMVVLPMAWEPLSGDCLRLRRRVSRKMRHRAIHVMPRRRRIRPQADLGMKRFRIIQRPRAYHFITHALRAAEQRRPTGGAEAAHDGVAGVALVAVLLGLAAQQRHRARREDQRMGRSAAAGILAVPAMTGGGRDGLVGEGVADGAALAAACHVYLRVGVGHALGGSILHTALSPGGGLRRDAWGGRRE